MGQDLSTKPPPHKPVLDELLIDAEVDDAELQAPARQPSAWLLLLGLVLVALNPVSYTHLTLPTKA